MDTINLIASFAVVGAALSLFVQYTKGFLIKESAPLRMLYTLGISVLGGLMIYYSHYVPTSIVTDVVGMIGAVNSVYLIVVQWIPTGQPV